MRGAGRGALGEAEEAAMGGWVLGGWVGEREVKEAMEGWGQRAGAGARWGPAAGGGRRGAAEGRRRHRALWSHQRRPAEEAQQGRASFTSKERNSSE